MSAAHLHRRQIDRLRALGVEFSALSGAARQALLERFADAFVDPARRAPFLAALAQGRSLEFDRFVRAECVRGAAPAGGSLGWLGGGGERARCYRLERDASLPVLDIQLASLDEIWATSWPGVFVSFRAGRALIVTLDYERIHCDLRSATPYR